MRWWTVGNISAISEYTLLALGYDLMVPGTQEQSFSELFFFFKKSRCGPLLLWPYILSWHALQEISLHYLFQSQSAYFIEKVKFHL